MADFNTGSHNLAREDPPTPNVPGAFPGESGKYSNGLSANIVVPQTQPVISGESPQQQHYVRGTTSLRSTARSGEEAPIVTAINDQTPSAHASHPTGEIQPSFKKSDDDILASAAERQVLEQMACPIEASPVDKEVLEDGPRKNHQNQDTVTAGELVQGIAAGATTAVAAAAKAAQDAAAWATNKAVENYPTARDTTVKAATAAGETTQSAVMNAASALPGSVKGALVATTMAATGDADTDTNTPWENPAPGVPAPVRSSIRQAGTSPEAAANPEAVQDKQILESQLLTIAKVAGVDTEEERTALKGISPDITHDSPAHKGDGRITAVGAPGENNVATSEHQHREHPQRAESTDYVKILGTETIKHQIHAVDRDDSRQSTASAYAYPLSESQNVGPGAEAIHQSFAHGGGPAGAPVRNRDSLKSSGPLGNSDAHTDISNSLKAGQRHDGSPSIAQKEAAAIGSAVAAGGIGHGLSTFSHRVEDPTRSQHHAEHSRSTGTAAQTPGNGTPNTQVGLCRQQPSPPSHGQSQGITQNYDLSSGANAGMAGNLPHDYSRSIAKPRHDGRNLGEEISVEYNKLGSGTVSGVADTHVHTK